MPVPTYLAPPVNASSLVYGSTTVSNSNQVQSSSYSYNTNSSKFTSSSAASSSSASLLFSEMRATKVFYIKGYLHIGFLDDLRVIDRSMSFIVTSSKGLFSLFHSQKREMFFGGFRETRA
ncbi:hypothetical protein ACSBR1_022452 [Camellia fascicularis]